MGKSSGSNKVSTTSTSGPPQQFLDAYTDVLARAKGVADVPLTQYDIGTNAANVVAPLHAYQTEAMGDIAALKGIQTPYFDTAKSYFTNAGTPIKPMAFQGVETLPSRGLAGFDFAMNAGSPANFASGVQSYLNPYTQNVTDALRKLYTQQNAEQLNQVKGNAAAQGAFGGDREAIAEAETARQQALAQNPVLAQIQQQGYTQAADQLRKQQGLSLAGAQGLLGEFNALQKADIGAQEATGWLSQGAGQGMATLGKEAQSTGLIGANALLGAGGIYQKQRQAELNAPYEQFIQRQAYPFQTTGWLANIAEGLGGASGGTGTSSTTYPKPSSLNTYGGLALSGLGLAGSSGLFDGWGSYGDYGGGGDYIQDWEKGGRVERAQGGLAEPPRFATGGVPDLSLSFIPGADGLGVKPPSSGGGLSKMFMQPVTTQTQEGGGGDGGGLLGLIGPAISIGKLFFDHGGRVNDEGGGRITLTIPDLSKPYIPLTQPPSSKMGPPTPQPPSLSQPPNSQGLDILKSTEGLSKLFKNERRDSDAGGGDEGTGYGGGSDSVAQALGGAVEPSSVLRGFQGGGAPNYVGTQQQSRIDQYAQMSIEQLQELAMRYPPTTPQGIAIARALQAKKMRAATLTDPLGLSDEGSPAARGGRMGLAGFDKGGEIDPGPGDFESEGLSLSGDGLTRPPPIPLDKPMSGVPVEPDDDTRPSGSRLMRSGKPVLPPSVKFNSKGEPYSTESPGGVLTGTVGAGKPISREEANAANAADTAPGTHLPVMPSAYVFGPGLGAPPGAGLAGAPSDAGLAAVPSPTGPASNPEITPFGPPPDGLATPNQAAARTVSHNDPRGLSPMIAEKAAARGIDPNVAIRVAGSEGLGAFKSTIPGEESYAAFQLNMLPGSLGDQFQKQTGLDPRDPKNEPATIDYALDHAAQHGWGAFHGAKRVGIGPWDGITSEARIAGTNREAVDSGIDQLIRAGDSGLPSGPRSEISAGLAKPIPTTREREPRKASFMSSPWMPLIAAGAGMLASRSPYPGVALGEGLQTALKVAGQQEDRSTKGELAEIRAQSVENQAKNLANTAELRAKELERRQTQGEAALTLRGQLADAATLRAQTALANAASAAEARDINAKLRQDLADIKKGEGAWTQGPGPSDPDDPSSPQVQGMWHTPKSPDPTKPNGGIKFYAGVGAPKTGTVDPVLADMVKSGAAANLGEADRIRQSYRRDPSAFTKSAEYAKGVQAQLRIMEKEWDNAHPMQPAPANLAARAAARYQQILGGAPTITATPPAAGAAPPRASAPQPGTVTQPTPGAAGAPAWAKGTASAPNGTTIYTDGKGWFNANHSPYAP